MFEVKPICPQLRKQCIESKCKAWMSVKGQDPQTGEQYDRYDCYEYVWKPKFQLEQTKEFRHSSASVEKLVNIVAQAMMWLSGKANDAKTLGSDK